MAAQAIRTRLYPSWSGARRWRVTLALVVASLLWGSLYPAARPALAATGPMQVTFCRVLLAFVSLAAFILLRSGPGLLTQQRRAPRHAGRRSAGYHDACPRRGDPATDGVDSGQRRL